MGYILGIGGQKGGTGKTVIATTAAVEALRAGVRVILYDVDHTQQTANMWAQRRRENGIKPDVEVVVTSREHIPAVLNGEDVSVIDLPGFADRQTAQLARHCDLFVLPSGTDLNDLDTTILVAHELTNHGIEADRIFFAITKAPDEKSAESARAYIHSAGYQTLKGYVRFTKSIAQAQSLGQALTEVRGDKLQQEINALFESLTRELGRSRGQLHVSGPLHAAEEEKKTDRSRSMK